MKKVNLREFYPSLYTKDTYVFLPDDVVTALWEETKRERAGYAKIRYHRAYYSLDREDGIERFALHSPMPVSYTHLDVYKRQHSCLPDGN